MTQQATKLVILTEKVLMKEILKMVEDAGGVGFVVMPITGKDARSARASGTGISDTFNNVKIEVITATPELAKQISDDVAAKYFKHYSGITYREPVEVLHSHNF